VPKSRSSWLNLPHLDHLTVAKVLCVKVQFLEFGGHGPLSPLCIHHWTCGCGVLGVLDKAGINPGISFSYSSDLRNCKFTINCGVNYNFLIYSKFTSLPRRYQDVRVSRQDRDVGLMASRRHRDVSATSPRWYWDETFKTTSRDVRAAWLQLQLYNVYAYIGTLLWVCIYLSWSVFKSATALVIQTKPTRSVRFSMWYQL